MRNDTLFDGSLHLLDYVGKIDIGIKVGNDVIIITIFTGIGPDEIDKPTHNFTNVGFFLFKEVGKETVLQGAECHEDIEQLILLLIEMYRFLASIIETQYHLVVTLGLSIVDTILLATLYANEA